MADITIRFKHNPKTGKRELVIAYESESDALPHEHERDHREAAKAILGASLGKDMPEAELSREDVTPVQAESQTSTETPSRTAQKTSS